MLSYSVSNIINLDVSDTNCFRVININSLPNPNTFPKKLIFIQIKSLLISGLDTINKLRIQAIGTSIMSTMLIKKCFLRFVLQFYI